MSEDHRPVSDIGRRILEAAAERDGHSMMAQRMEQVKAEGIARLCQAAAEAAYAQMQAQVEHHRLPVNLHSDEKKVLITGMAQAAVHAAVDIGDKMLLAFSRQLEARDKVIDALSTRLIETEKALAAFGSGGRGDVVAPVTAMATDDGTIAGDNPCEECRQRSKAGQSRCVRHINGGVTP